MKDDKTTLIKLLGTLGLVVLLVASWFFLLSPQMDKVSDIKAQTEQTQMENTAKQAEISDLEQKEQQLPAAIAAATRLTDKFPPTAEQAALFSEIKRIAADAGIPEDNVTALTPAVPQKGSSDGSVGVAEDPNAGSGAGDAAAGQPGEIASMMVDITVTGAERQLVNFVNGLENADRSYLLSNVSYSPVSEEGGGQTFSMSISGNMFLLPPLVDPTAPQQ